MIARAQRWVVALLLLAAGAWALYFAWRGSTWIALLGVFAIVNTQSLLIAVEYLVLMPYANRHDPTPRASIVQRFVAWYRESWTGHLVFSWRQPFQADFEPDSLFGLAGQRALVLVHGFFCNRGLWNPWMRRLRALRVPHMAVTLEPPYCSIDEYVPIVDAAIERAWRATGVAPVVVAHSMGGLAMRAWWRTRGAAADERVAQVITIGTPHHGTLAALFAHGVNARQMRLSSPWLAQLAAAEPTERYAKFICFYSHCDNISMPTRTATLPGADNRHLSGQPHVAMAYDERVFIEALSRARG